MRDTRQAVARGNVEIVKRAFEAFNRGDLDAAVADVAADCRYIASGAVPGFADAYRGPEGYKRFMGWLVDQFDEARVELAEVIEAGDQVVARVTSKGRGWQSGVETSMDVWQVWTIRDAKAVHGVGFRSREEALAAAGLKQ
jgi:ketosteroid isomerase-like protein